MMIALLAAVCVPARAGAQRVQQVAVGSRVRVEAALPYGDVEGRVSRIDGGTVQVAQSVTTAPMIVPMGAIRTVQVRLPRSRMEGVRHWGLWGGVGGALLGLAAGAAGGNPALGAAVGGGAGLVGGGYYGAQHPGQQWVSVPTASLRPTPAPAPRRKGSTVRRRAARHH